MRCAAIFDMDGLIIDSEPHWRRAEIECFKRVGLELTEDDCRRTMGYRLNEVIEFWYARSPWKGYSLSRLEDDIVDRVIDLIEQSARALPGAHHSIDRFNELGFHLAVASSSPERLIAAVLRVLDLEGPFEVVHSAQHETWGKPHPQVFLSAAQKMLVEPTNCIVLEDSFHGVIAGKAAKMKVVAVPDSHDRHLPGFGAADLIINSLEELDDQKIKNLLTL